MREFFTSRFATIGDFFSSQSFVLSDLKNLFSWKYWTESNIPPQTPYFLATLLATIAVIVAAVFWRRHLKRLNTIAPVYEGPINQLANIITFIIIIAITYAFFRAQEIGYLSSRLVLLASLVVVVGWIGWVVFYLVRVAPTKSQEYLERERFFRYIPNNKGNSSRKKRN